MTIKDKLTPTEIKLFKEAVIREYQLKKEATEKKANHFNLFLKKLKKITPINIIVGIIASILIVMIRGWQDLAYILLYGVIWITLISTVISTFFETK